MSPRTLFHALFLAPFVCLGAAAQEAPEPREPADAQPSAPADSPPPPPREDEAETATVDDDNVYAPGDSDLRQDFYDSNLPFGLGWLDQTQAYASDQANTAANRLDRFFGVPRSDLEAAYSSLRLTVINAWSDIDGYEPDVRLRGKLHLPRINERISLIFSEDEGDGTSYYNQAGTSAPQNQQTKVNLEFNFLDRLEDRLDFRLGLSSSLKGRVSLRYRHEQPLGGDFFHRVTQTGYFRDGSGFGSITRYQLERTVGEPGLVRWDNDVRFEESFDGSEWNTGISYSYRHSESTGIVWFARMGGVTKPDFITAQDVGVRIRRNILRPWLFIEMEPGWTWQREEDDAPREDSPFLFLRFEMAIGRLDG